MDPSTALLYLFLTLAFVGGIGVVTFKHPVHSAVSLLGSMLSLAAAYAMLGAHLIAVLQILIYGGAIVILIVYVIMLLDLGKDHLRYRRLGLVGLPMLLLFVVLGVRMLAALPADAAPSLAGESACVAGEPCEAQCADHKDDDGDGLTDCADSDCGSNEACFGTVKAVGASLLGPYVLPFEVASVLLLAGIVGAILLTQKVPAGELPAPPRRAPRVNQADFGPTSRVRKPLPGKE